MTWLIGLVICLCFAFAIPCPSAATEGGATRQLQLEKLFQPGVKPVTTIGDFDSPKDLLVRQLHHSPSKQRQMKLGSDLQGLADAAVGQSLIQRV
jgi:thiamine pyrophosphokinase